MKITSLVHHSICPDLVTAGSVVLDLGANYGAFANATASRFRCDVYAVEASPLVFAKMPAGDLVKKFNFAICGRSGAATLNISSNHEVTSLKRLDNWEYIDTVKVEGLSLDEFLKTASIPQIDLLKVDIEGAEIEVFNSCSDAFLRSIDQITVEFHEWVGGSSKTEVKDVVSRLQALGFFVFKLSRANFSDVLFVHRRHMSFIDYASTIVGIWAPRIFRYARRRLSKRY
jgi:FkbM family methyltransferase